jgi:two-component system nitrate/nitrite response regulator NarL
MVNSQAKPIRILIVDDHSLFREGLVRLLDAADDFEVQGHCATVEAGIDILRAKPVDVILLDFDLGLQRATEFQVRVRHERLERPTLIVTAGLTKHDAVRVMQLGARGIFVKHRPPETLAVAIRKVAAGQEWLDERYADVRQMASRPLRDEEQGSAPLTDRERAVLRGVFEGHANKEIADQLAISEAAVKAALQRLFQKTGVRTRGQLVRVALEQL